MWPTTGRLRLYLLFVNLCDSGYNQEWRAESIASGIKSFRTYETNKEEDKKCWRDDVGNIEEWDNLSNTSRKRTGLGKRKVRVRVRIRRMISTAVKDLP